MRGRLTGLALALLTLGPVPARAEWKEAASTNFIVYSEGSETQLREFSARLEKFNWVLRTYHQVTAPPSPVKLKVYLLADIPAVGRMAGSGGVAGFYIQRARSPMLVGTKAVASNGGIDSEEILLHEYTHHFMYRFFPASYPTWYSEGFAEFWGATDIRDNDVVEIGMPAEHRFRSFTRNRWLPVAKLLTAQSYADVPELDLLYAEGWLLTRFAFDRPDIRQKLQVYLTAINAGRSYQKAAADAFGDLDALNSDLFAYAGRAKFSIVRLPFKKIETGPIAIRTLSPAEQALLSYEIRLGRGVLQREAAEFAREVRSATSRFGEDPFALAILAEAEGLAGNRAGQEAALERLLKAAPDHARGLMWKAALQIDALKAAGSVDKAAWDGARRLIVRASRSAPNDALVLEAYHDSFTAEGVLPPAAAQNALYKAMQLTPSDDELRYKVAADFERRGMIEEAIAIIRPEAYMLPHKKPESNSERRKREEREERFRRAGSARHETAREMLDRLEAKLRGTGARS